MKKNFLLIFILLLFCSFNIMTASANNGQSAGSMGGNEVVIPVAPTGSKWVWDSSFKGAQGIKITVYKKDGTKLETQAFINNQSQVDSLNKNGIMVKTSNEERLKMNIEKGSWSKSGNGYFQYLNYTDYVNIKVKLDIVTALKGEDEEELIQKLGVSQYSEVDLKDLVLVVEPATTFKRTSDEVYFFGTYWEFMYMSKNNTGEKDFGWMFNGLYFNDGKNNIFGSNLKISPNEVTSTNPEASEIWEFLGASQFSTFRSKVADNNSLGVAIILLSDIIPTSPTEKECTTTVTKGSCDTNFSVKEPTDRDCVVNNSKYQYSSVGDCGTIYCSENVSTDLNNFYRTFTPIIKSGSYFKMNNVEVDVTRTCYLVERSSSAICNNWQNNILKETAGTISLDLVSNYTLVEDSNNSSFEVKCDSYSGEKCTKATATQHVEYVLEPNTNRYISIEDMAGTASSSGNNVVDLGGEHLTTPISFSTGKHSYTINYQGADILFDSIGRLTTQDINLTAQKLILKYSHTQSLTSGDLKYSCEYTVKSSAEICPEDQCCEGNKIVPCPCVCDSITGCDENCNPIPEECDCAGECCDSNCNVVECVDPDKEPGGFPNVVYRPINLGEAFPGEKGIGRDVGSNWYGYVYDSNGNTINKPNGTPYTKEEYYINYNRGYNDYDVYQSEPLYVIKLDYNALKEIREYNDLTNHDYNDFTLTCTNGENCISNFLRGNVNGFDRNLITGGTCKDINSRTFDSCVSTRGA